MYSVSNLFSSFKTYSSGGSIWLMSGLNRISSDYRDLITIARYFAKKGHKVVVLASTHYRDPIYHKVFGALIGTRYYRKCPDLIIDDNFYEYESYVRPFSSKKISHMLKRGAEQSDRIIIDNNKGATDRYIVNMILKRLKDPHFLGYISMVHVYEKGEVRLLFKKSGREF